MPKVLRHGLARLSTLTGVRASAATIRGEVRLGDYALVGTGAAVISDVPENAVVVGNPARGLKAVP
jgi:serine acetyltransferase